MIVKKNEDGSIDKKLVMERCVGSEYLNAVPYGSFQVTKSNGDFSILTGQNIHYGINYPLKPQAYIFDEEILKRQREGMLDALSRRLKSESTGAGIVHSMAYQYTNIQQVHIILYAYITIFLYNLRYTIGWMSNGCLVYTTHEMGNDYFT